MSSRQPWTAAFPGWLGANLLGWLLAAATLVAAGRLLAGAGSLSNGLQYAGFAAAGAIIGLAQWLVLRTRWALSGRAWMALTAVGFGLGLTGMAWSNLLDLYTRSGPMDGLLFEWDSLIGDMLVGLAVGGCQALAWWRSPPSALLWFLCAGLGWSAGLFLADLGTQLFFGGQVNLTSLLLTALVPPAAAALATWPALYRLSQ